MSDSTDVAIAMSTTGLLDSVRVVDLTTGLGTYATKLMADQGAEVIRVEPPGGCSSRTAPPHFTGSDGERVSLVNEFLGSNKHSITVNFATAEGAAILQRLLTSAHIVVDSMTPTERAERNLSISDVWAVNPRVVWTAVTPFGQDGPYASYLASDIVGLAMGGLLYLGGNPDREPLAAYGSQAVTLASLHAAVGTLLALYEADESGYGQLVDVSMQEAVSATLENAVEAYELGGVIRRRRGSGLRRAGIGLFECADGYVYLYAAGLGGSPGWRNLVNWLLAEGVAGAAELEEAKWSDGSYRETESATAFVRELIAPFTATRAKRDLYLRGQAFKVPLAPVNTPADLLAEPQLVERDFFKTVPGKERDVVHPGPPFRVSGASDGPAPAEAPGESNGRLLRDLGFDADRIEELERLGIV
jgi:benzylsuccinate CoA-transferase BbsE subunit